MGKYKYKDNILKIYINNKWQKIDLQEYDFIDEIGNGANGIVLKAQHKITQRIDAIKIWMPNKKSKDGKVSEKQYLNEIRKISKLNHSNIVTIYNAHVTEDGIYMSMMEYIKGKSLNEWLKGYNGIDKKIRVCKKILQTVLDYQSSGIIHGDLHGENIIISKDENIHIIDFGTSLYGHRNQSKERENYFCIDLVKKILGEYYNEKCFAIKNYKLNNKIIYDNDSRLCEPILVTKTLIHYIEIVNIRILSKNLNDKETLIEYCYNIAHGIYFNLNGVLKDVLSWNDVKIKDNFLNCLYANIDNTMFGECNSCRSEDISFTTLYIYYEIFKEIKEDINYEEAKESFLKLYRQCVSEDEYIKNISKLKNSKANSYIDYHNELIDTRGNSIEIYELHMHNRMILSDIIMYYNGFMIYEVWKRLNIIWLDEKLHNNILRISFICVQNGFVD
ncbi:protein kinase domain-containing protein [Clostridium ihumii]|uniref:protein kinase domain-containing protein n=1 Tax=Clostridium ihumii TaxID=1470356 RepID=UPI00055837A4|nr:protein kinase [Clostridium ihumii]